ncbi:hypothetical protein C2E23DRAFT_835175 [Lenzites betulinus]|nr:hypothetical protein C2E23DRAFT_835175 [Lenzites betulinus]
MPHRRPSVCPLETSLPYEDSQKLLANVVTSDVPDDNIVNIGGQADALGCVYEVCSAMTRMRSDSVLPTNLALVREYIEAVRRMAGLRCDSMTQQSILLFRGPLFLMHRHT